MSSKITSERNQHALLELVAQPGNDICADCKSRNPRWASYNLGIFICVSCASIHRKLGTHITKVKSITLDAWTKEQIDVMKQNGNFKSNALYNPNEARHPPPTNMMEAERDSEIEKFIQAKYKFKWFMNSKIPQSAPLAPSSSNFVAARLNSIPPQTDPPPSKRKPSSASPPGLAQNLLGGGIVACNLTSESTSVPHTRSIPHPVPAPDTSSLIQEPSGNQVWDDLISLQGPSQSPSLPSQYQSQNSFEAPLNPFPTMHVSRIMPSPMPSMSDIGTSITPMHLVAACPSPVTSFQPQFTAYSFPNTVNSFSSQMMVGNVSGTPAATSLHQQNHFASSLGQLPQPAFAHMQIPGSMYPQPQTQVVQQQYSPQLSYGVAPSFVAQEPQQPVFTSSMDYGGWQHMHGNL